MMEIGIKNIKIALCKRVILFLKNKIHVHIRAYAHISMCTQTEQRVRRNSNALEPLQVGRAMWGSLRTYTHTCLHNI